VWAIGAVDIGIKLTIPPTCTCAQCSERRLGRGGPEREPRTGVSFLNSGPIRGSVTVIQNIFRAHTIVSLVAIIAIALVANGLSGVHLENESAASSQICLHDHSS